jgi:hypothetical protein
MKRLLLTLVAGLFISSVTFAGNTWEAYKEQDGITMKTKTLNCDPEYGFEQETILLQITNTSSVDKTVSWDLQLWYNNICKTCTDPHGEYHMTITVKAGETLEGVCSNVTGDYRLTIFSKFTDVNYTNSNPDFLTSFDLANFTITE